MACVFGSPAASCPQTEIHSDYLVKSVHRSKSKWGDVFFSLSLEVNRPYLLRINWPEYPRWSSSEDVPLIDQAKAPSPPPLPNSHVASVRHADDDGAATNFRKWICHLERSPLLPFQSDCMLLHGMFLLPVTATSVGFMGCRSGITVLFDSTANQFLKSRRLPKQEWGVSIRILA